MKWLTAPVVAACALWGAPVLAAAPVAAINDLPTDAGYPPELNAMLTSGRYQEALDLLNSRPDLLADEKGFLLKIHLLERTGQDDKAVILLEHRLSKDPNDGLARFEIANIHFRHKRERQATLDYRLALAGGLDDGRAMEAHSRLEGIVQRKAWHVWAGAALTANNNLNDTTDITRLAIYGLPFNESAPGGKKDGFAVSGYVGVGKLIALSPGLGIRTNILAAGTHDPGRLYDSRSLSIQSGPEWTFGHVSHVSVNGRAISQWLGSALAMSGAGLSLHGDTYGNNVLWAGDVSADRLDVKYKTIGVHWNYRAEVKRVKYLDASALWIFDAVVARRGATFDTLSFSEQQVKAGRLLQGPWSTFAYVEATARSRQYNSNPLFAGLRRNDTYGQLLARFSKRDVVIYGATPYISVAVQRNDSSIHNYNYKRLRMDIGFTRDF
ncbi:MAG TPA: surface lipoprotein assembly modifier [Asticcacaulis sp.]|nr:surface lipoprotein assembly modifier [Asticcacaulis sp.]